MASILARMVLSIWCHIPPRFIVSFLDCRHPKSSQAILISEGWAWSGQKRRKRRGAGRICLVHSTLSPFAEGTWLDLRDSNLFSVKCPALRAREVRYPTCQESSAHVARKHWSMTHGVLSLISGQVKLPPPRFHVHDKNKNKTRNRFRVEKETKRDLAHFILMSFLFNSMTFQ